MLDTLEQGAECDASRIDQRALAGAIVSHKHRKLPVELHGVRLELAEVMDLESLDPKRVIGKAHSNLRYQ